MRPAVLRLRQPGPEARPKLARSVTRRAEAGEAGLETRPAEGKRRMSAVRLTTRNAPDIGREAEAVTRAARGACGHAGRVRRGLCSGGLFALLFETRNVFARGLSNEQSDNAGEMFRSAERGEGIHWRPWPCRHCDAGLSPIGFIVRSSEAGSAIREDEPERLAASQIALLQSWVSKCCHLPEQQLSLPKIAEGSEHEVFLRADVAQVFKLTRPHTFGESYFLKENIVHQRNCSPLDYLIRLRLWKKVFGSAPSDLGITTTGQIVTEQKYIAGDLPNQDRVNEFLESSGFIDVKHQCFLWKKPFEEFDIWLGDARDENFVETPKGIVPIDIRMWFASKTE